MSTEMTMTDAQNRNRSIKGSVVNPNYAGYIPDLGLVPVNSQEPVIYPPKAENGKSPCPPGLEPLLTMDKLLIKQEVEIAEVCCGCEHRNKYSITDVHWKSIYKAEEESECCQRICCGAKRAFTLVVRNKEHEDIIRIKRRFKCCACNICCCLGFQMCADELEVESPPGTVIGYIIQRPHCIRTCYSIRDANEEEHFRLYSPICVCPCRCAKVPFNLYDIDGEKVGKICKHWSGLVKECCTKADNFSVQFPADLDVRFKATLIAAAFLVDFNYFEHDDKQEKETE